jgi:metal-dependent amidase/aminoacylase/carboxypeptidase family protein
MAAADFALMLEARPGNMIFIGNSDTAALHHPAYDFNDEAMFNWWRWGCRRRSEARYPRCSRQ